MAVILHPGRWGRNKPPLGSQIQFGHPLAQGLIGAWLFNERVGTKVFDLTGGGNHLTLTGSAVWAPFWNLTDGLYAPNSGTYPGAQIAAPTSRLKPTAAVTVIWRGIIHSNGTRTSHPMFFGCNYNTSGSSPFVSYSIGRRDTGSGYLTVFYSAGGSFTELSTDNQLGPGNPVAYFAPINLGFSRRSGSTKVYAGSRLVNSDTVAGDLTYSAASTINLNHRNNATSNNSCDTTTDIVWVWDRALTADQFAWLDAEPYAFIEGPALGRTWAFVVAANISDAGGIASTAAIGTPTVTGPTVLTDVGGIASTAALGSPTLTPSLYDVGGISSTAAVGQPVIAAIKIDDGGGIASTAAVGSPTLTLTISGAGGIASTVQFAKPVVFNQTGRAFTFFIGGVDRSKYVRWGSLDITHQLGSRGTCRMRLIPEMHGRTVLSSYIPTMYDEVIIHHNESGLRLFGGEVESIARTVPSGSADYHEIDLAAIDFGVVLDRIAMAHWYTIFLGSYVPIILRHIVDTFLQGTGITYDGAGPFGGYLGEQLCNWRYVGEFLRQICDEAGLDYRVDVYRFIRLVDRTTGYEAAPFAIEQDDGNWRSLKATESRGKFANRVIVRNSQDITPLWIDTATLSVLGIYNTTYPQSVKPIVLVDGVEQVVAERGQLGATPGVKFYYIQDGPGLFAASGAPTSGTLTIRYPSKTSYVAIAEDAESIAIRGRWDHIEEVRDLQDPDAMQQHADGLLTRLGVIPVNLDLETDRAGLEPGQLLSVDANGVTGAFLIEQIQISEVYDTYARWTIRGSNAPQRGAGADWFSRLLTSARRQPVDRVDSAVAFVLAESIEGDTNPGLTVGSKNAMRFARKSGYAKIARLYFNSVATTPTTSMIEIDMLQNGLSIFGGTYKMLFPPGSQNVQVNFYFREQPLRVLEGDVFTVNVIRADALAKDGFFELQVQG